MQEDLLQFIWQHNLYRPAELYTSGGAAVRVIHPGTLNRNAGPDFSLARVRIGDTVLVGNVELHLRSSDWLRHRHDADPAYSRVILHVVYEHDTEALPGGIEVLPLKAHIADEVIERYSSLIRTTAVLPCAGALHRAPGITRSAWLSRMLVERWEQKLGRWEAELQQAGGDWHTLFYWRLASNFGFKVNAAPFLLLAQSLPLKVLRKHASLFQIEALIFGQAGLLGGRFSDEYPVSLRREYGFLQSKYALSPIDPSLWKFLRLRPANFPTIRLAQLAALIHNAPQLFSAAGGDNDVSSLRAALSVKAGGYWDSHYRWDEPQRGTGVKALGADAIQNIIINTIAPIRFLYAKTHGHDAAAEAALSLLDALPAEDNNIIRMWTEHGWQPGHAGDSQAMIELFHSYCTRKRCLSCAVGLSIIRPGPDK
jgi:hypothetical protein